MPGMGIVDVPNVIVVHENGGSPPKPAGQREATPREFDVHL